LLRITNDRRIVGQRTLVHDIPRRCVAAEAGSEQAATAAGRRTAAGRHAVRDGRRIRDAIGDRRRIGDRRSITEAAPAAVGGGGRGRQKTRRSRECGGSEQADGTSSHCSTLPVTLGSASLVMRLATSISCFQKRRPRGARITGGGSYGGY